MARIARGEVINLGVPEWASLTDYRDSLEGHGFWEAGLDTDYWAGIGVGLVTDPAGMLDIMRWTAVNKVARAHQSTAEYDAIRDALLRAEESGAGLEDDPEAMRFRLVGARPDAGAMLGLNRDLVEQILSKSYRLAVRPIRGDYADTYHFRLWRTTLIGALEKGDLQLAEDLIDRNQEAAANLSEQRGWAKLYPAAVQMFETLQKVYL
jgi:hypothetical protein